MAWTWRGVEVSSTWGLVEMPRLGLGLSVERALVDFKASTTVSFL